MRGPSELVVVPWPWPFYRRVMGVDVCSSKIFHQAGVTAAVEESIRLKMDLDFMAVRAAGRAEFLEGLRGRETATAGPSNPPRAAGRPGK